MACWANKHVMTYGSSSSETVGLIPNQTCDCGAVRRSDVTANEIGALTALAEQAERRLAALTEAGNALVDRIAYEHQGCGMDCSAIQIVERYRAARAEAMGSGGEGAG